MHSHSYSDSTADLILVIFSNDGRKGEVEVKAEENGDQFLASFLFFFSFCDPVFILSFFSLLSGPSSGVNNGMLYGISQWYHTCRVTR